MKIAYLVGRYPAVSHTFILGEVRGLRERGVEIETISIHRAGDDQLLTDAEREEFATTYTVLPARWTELVRAHALAFARAPRRYLSTLALAMRLTRPGIRARIWQLFYFAEAMVVWRRCRERGIRHLHAHFTNQVTDVALLVTAYERGRSPRWTWSFTVHGPDEFYEVTRFNLAPKVERADFVVCISDFARSQLMTLVSAEHWDKMSVVHCGVDPERFSAPQRRSSHERLEVLCIGRLVPVKGQALLVEAIAALSERGVNVRATIVGAGPAREQVERLAEARGAANRVELTGAVGQDRIRELYAAADVFCLPSFAEGVPVVLMEAMATELPVVTSRLMGIPELVEDGVNGVLFAPGNTRQLVDALERLADDPKERRRLGVAGRQKVLAEYSITGSTEQLDALFRRLVD